MGRKRQGESFAKRIFMSLPTIARRTIGSERIVHSSTTRVTVVKVKVRVKVNGF